MRALTFEILRRLADGRFHSGPALAGRLQVSRTAIWEALSELPAELSLFRVRGRGYRLAAPVVWLDAAVLSGFWQVEVADQLESSNAALLRLGDAAHRRCLAVEYQTAGRGRRGRGWQAPLGGSLAFSVGWRFPGPPGELSGLSLAVGLALLGALRRFGVDGLALKWPNDLLRHGRKLAGVLIEMQGEAHGPSLVVIGLGVNLRLSALSRQAIDQPVADLADLPQPVERNHLLGLILAELEQALARFAVAGFAPCRSEFDAAHAFHQRAVTLLMPDGSQCAARVDGVSARGALMVTTAAGAQELTSGEISLRRAS